MMGNAVGSLTFLMTAAAQMGAESASLNMMKALNAGRCAVVNLGDNFYNFVAMSYFLAKQFGEEEQFKKQTRIFARHVCTCKKETDKLAKKFGGN